MSLAPEEQEIRIVQHWYQNWSESQRLEFLNYLTAKFDLNVSDLTNSLERLSFSRQSPTIFECQLRQFSVWFDNWSLQGPIGIAEQLNYLIQWFVEYSEMQKDDFYIILKETYSRTDINGVANSVNNLELNDQRPSIFQCRMKLFREWYATWSEEEKNEFLARLGRMDEKFMEKFYEDMGINNVE